MNKRQVADVESTIRTTAADLTITTTTNTATTPTTSALLQESRQLLLKQQLKLKLNINVSEMMDNIRRNVDDKEEYLNYNIKESSNSRHDGDRGQDIKVHEEIEEDNEMDDVEEMKRKKKDFNKLDTVTTVPQLQQKFNKFNIIDGAAITTNTTATTLKTTCVVAAKTSTRSSSSSPINTNISLTQQKNTALAKFNRIIDNTMPVINAYNYQQHVAQTLVKSSEQQQEQHIKQQHPYYYQTQEQKYVEMPILSDSLKRRLTNNHHQYTDISVSNSKINFSSAAITTASTSKDIVATAALTTSKASATTALAMLANSSSQQEQEQKQEINTASSLNEDEQLKRNDVHYLLKQLNSFSDIEEIEIVDMKQKQRIHQQQQQQQQKQQLQEQIYSKKKNHTHQQQSPQNHSAKSEPIQHVDRVEQLCFSEYQHVERIRQHVDIVETKFDTNVSMPQATQHVYSDQLHLSASEIQLQTQAHSEQHVEDSHRAIVVGKQTYTNAESKQHFETISTTSPTATSLVIYSPSSQSHKGIRRYASHDEHAASYHLPNQTSSDHHHFHHYHVHPHHLRLPHENCFEGSIFYSAAAETAVTDPLILQQFVDDYIFQSCHYLETNNFVANYRTAMVESSSHEFRPSTTNTTTRTSNEEFYEGEGAGYVEDHSSAHSFVLHETEPPTVICKAPAPLAAVSRLKQQQQYTMETRLCNSGVQTDLMASSLAQSLSLSSSLSSSEKHKRRQPLFKCCYTPLDRWREKRSQQQQSQIEKRTKSATATVATTTTNITNEPQKLRKQQRQQHQQTITKNTSVAVVGGPSSSVSCSSAILNSIAATTTSATTTTIINTASTLVIQPQHQHHHQSLLKNKNAPYPV